MASNSEAMSEIEARRFWQKVAVVASGCWEWTATLTSDGYGQFSLRGTLKRAHRLSVVAVRGPIPVGMQIDHLCRNRACVNPQHLEVVTPGENSRRAIGRRLVVRGRCKSGRHAIEGPLDYYVSPDGWHGCRRCKADSAGRMGACPRCAEPMLARSVKRHMSRRHESETDR